MGTKVTIQVTKFVNVDSFGYESQEAQYGFRAYDDYGTVYSNNFTKEEILNKTPRELVDLVREYSEDGKDMIDGSESVNNGIIVNGVHYSWEELSNS